MDSPSNSVQVCYTKGRVSLCFLLRQCSNPESLAFGEAEAATLAETGTSKKELCKRSQVLAKCCFTCWWRETWATAQEPSRERTCTRSCVLGTSPHPGPDEPSQSPQLRRRVCSESRACPAPQNSRCLRVQLYWPQRKSCPDA